MKKINKIQFSVASKNIASILLIIVGLYLPKASFAQEIPLGTSSTFAIFTSVGAIDNVGETSIIGDIGTNVGAFNGFPPGNILGLTQVANAASAQTALDVEIAYDYLFNLPCDSIIGITLGNNQVLTPNVYCLTEASTLNGILVLDGQGDTNAIFVFKIDGAFATSVSSQIVLIDSTKLCNVYWQVNGLFTLGDSSIFRGTVVANGAINLLNKSVLNGRGLSRAGAISLLDVNVIALCNLLPVPIELTSFIVECINGEALVSWSTASELNNDYFSIERSRDAIHWECIGEVGGSGNTSIEQDYTFVDVMPYSNNSYYWLKQTDYDGNFEYSNSVFYISCKNKLNSLILFPNPASEMLSMFFKGDKNDVISISIFNSMGLMIYSSKDYELKIDVSSYNKGVYFVHFLTTSGLIIKKLAVV
jgi:hypothetical protein